MNVPVEFIRLTQCFWQGSDREAHNEKDWIARCVKMMTLDHRAKCKEFISELLDSNASTETLQDAWRSGSPSYGLYDQHIRRFFEMLRDAL